MSRTTDVNAATGMDPVNCKGCGKLIFWAVDEAGTRIPLDPTPPVYQLEETTQGRCTRAPLALVSHVVTCPQREQMRKRE